MYNCEMKIRLSKLRKSKNLLQKDIAKVLKVSQDRYSHWEREVDDISLIKVNELANFYNVNLDYLLGLSNKINITEEKNINFQTLCKHLFELRKENGLSQKELGNKIGFPQRTYANYEKGIHIPTTHKLLYIAIFYQISFDYLVGRTKDKRIK